MIDGSANSIPDLLAEAVERALAAVVGPEAAGPALLKPCADSRFGDYQANGILAVAKSIRQNPRQLAESVVGHLNLVGMCEPPRVEGPGFINFRLVPEFVARHATAAARDERLGVPAADPARTIVVDFSSPNVAKPMHVGHIRSTILGDCLARVSRFLGHRVVTDNHIGDWGTQFGMLIVGWKKFRNDAALAADPVAELERLYKQVYELSERDPATRAEARAELAKLQQGDADNGAIWRKIIDLSREEFQRIYERLGVTFDFILGESSYNPMLPAVVESLRERGIARESDQACCIFFDDDPDLKQSAPMIIQKADGAYLYATTDLATFRYRIDRWRPDEIMYVTDARQKLHFQQLFRAARRWWDAGAGGAPSADGTPARFPVLKHVYFGSILGEDGKPLKTREGAPVKLSALLDEAEERALAIVTEKNPELSADARRQIARVVGLGAVKYADLCQNRTTDYLFSWPKMLAMSGNTAPYLQYAYVRVQSIFRKAESGPEQLRPGAIRLDHPAELDLAKHLLRFPETLRAVVEDDKPNWLTAYLYELAGKFSAFYDHCPVIQSTGDVRTSRLMLCRFTADVMKRGLGLLGINVIEQM